MFTDEKIPWDRADAEVLKFLLDPDLLQVPQNPKTAYQPWVFCMNWC